MMFDSHSHIHDEKFLDDLDEVLKRAHDAGVTHLVTVGCDIETTQKAQTAAKKAAHIYFSAGFHPHEAKFCTPENLSLIKELAKDPKCVAIGECGLDYYYEHSNKAEQESAFMRQILLAKELELPLIIHLRDAHDACVEILQKHLSPGQKLVIHCFSGSLEEALFFAHMGCMISLSGIITFKKPGSLLKVAQELPLDKLLIETDCPYLAPHPYRGKRNEPAYLSLTLKAVASARGQSEAEVAQQIYQNSLDFFGISQKTPS